MTSNMVCNRENLFQLQWQTYCRHAATNFLTSVIEEHMRFTLKLNSSSIMSSPKGLLCALFEYTYSVYMNVLRGPELLFYAMPCILILTK